MTIRLKDLTCQFLLPLWQDQSLDVIDSFVAPTADIQTALVAGKGPSALKLHAKQTFSAFSALKFSISTIIQQNNQSVYQWSGTALHTGHILNIEPSGQPVTFSGIVSGTVAEGSLTHYHCFSDLPRVLTRDHTRPLPAPFVASSLASEEEQLFCLIQTVTGKKLTKRELECLGLWLKGFSLKASARSLGDLSSRTIQTFRENIKRKLNVSTYQQLLQLLQRNGSMMASENSGVF